MRTPEDDAYLGRTVLERGLVSREALLECLFQMTLDRKAGAPRPLGVLMVSKGCLTEDDLNGILASRVTAAGAAGSLPEAEVGRLLVASGLISKENVEECVRLQEELRSTGKATPPLGEVVVSRGYVTEGQVLRALAYQKKGVYRCAGCALRVTASPPPPGSRYRCRKCGGVLEPSEDATAAGSSLSLREGERGEESQLEIDRATAIYLKQKGIVRRDQLREGQRLQTEFSRYGLVVPLLELLRRISALSLQQQQQIEEMDFGRLVRDPDWKTQAVSGYRLQERVASGGFASIWTAETLFGSGRVAVKMLHPERAQDPRSVARFEWEAMLLRRFQNPRIVRGIDNGFDRGNHYLVMEYVEGRSLGQVLSESGAFPVREAVRITRQVAEALRYLHEQGFLHRDVKPDNVLLAANGDVKLCDLGFAVPVPKRAPMDPSETAVAVGTAGYMSPEAATAPATVGGDIYALGIHLYALLTGHEPFPGASSEEVVTTQISDGLPVPNLMVVQAPPPVVRTLKRMMHPDPARRFATVGEVVDELGRLEAP